MYIYLHYLFVIVNTKINLNILNIIRLNFSFFLFFSFSFIWTWCFVLIISRILFRNFFTFFTKEFLFNMRWSSFIFRYWFWWGFFLFWCRWSYIFFYRFNFDNRRRICLNVNCLLFWIKSLFNCFLPFLFLFNVSHFFSFFFFRYWRKFNITSSKRILKFGCFLIICSIIFFINFFFISFLIIYNIFI